ncbi:MAG: RNA methyltransferase [Proteobacteria bacterium]|nr:RNA methyltransferase [Pseudomonadota bacterium]
MRPPVVVLAEPQLAQNIGAVARVMANFGLEDLRLVRPRDGWPQRRAWEASSGADWILDAARTFDRTEDALADLRLVLASTARPREARLPVHTPRAAVAELRAVAQHGPVGLLFGGERAGLSAEDVALCQAIVTIPIDPRHWSLNLAQAVCVNAYEWRVALEDAPPPAFLTGDPPADAAALHGLFGHLESELEQAGFFHPPEKTPAMVRNLRVPLARARLTDQEVRTFRGVVAALVRGRGQRFARSRAAGEGA